MFLLPILLSLQLIKVTVQCKGKTLPVILESLLVFGVDTEHREGGMVPQTLRVVVLFTDIK